jgi:lysyl-tRNA synthetase class 2
MSTEDNAGQLSDFISGLPYSYRVSTSASVVKNGYAKLEGKHVSVAGRLISVRKAGKIVFVDLQDSSGRVQLYFEITALTPQVFAVAKALNPGDVLGAEGKVFKTAAGEVSVNVEKFEQLAKAVRPLPDKWHGLQDVELRYRKRYLDLIMNPEARETFMKRSRTIRLMQQFLDSRGFLEFETPTIQPLYGGGDAEPFTTQVKTLNEQQYLRIADELYLKRLIIGGFEKVYEICKDFRNEDIDTTHSPEFTMIEWYQAYADYNDMMELTEQLLSFVTKELLGKEEITYQGKTISMKAPFKRISFIDSINSKLGNGNDVMSLSDDELFKLAEGKGVKFEKGRRNRAHAYNKLLEVLVQPELVHPTFVIDFPSETSPLTRPKRGAKGIVERFELYVDGVELCNAYSELNNPFIQRENFEREEAKGKAGDREAEPMDEDFLEAMEYGMPPTGGLGMGVDRLVMLLTNKASMKEVILFPMEKRGRRK